MKNYYCSKIKPRAGLHGGGGPRVGEVTSGRSPHLLRKRDQIKMRDYMDRRVTPSKRVTSTTWGTPPPCKQALNHYLSAGPPAPIAPGRAKCSQIESASLPAHFEGTPLTMFTLKCTSHGGMYGEH